MEKIKKIDEFPNILEYFYYLKDSLDDLNQKKNRSISKDSQKFYSEQIDIIMKNRSSIRDVVLSKKEQIVHEKLSKLKDTQIKEFIEAKKNEKSTISQKKVNLELEIALYKSIFDLDDNFMTPIAKYAHEYNCSDFFVNDETYNKSFLVKDDNNKFQEYPCTIILSNYLGENIDLLDKLNKRHELKESFLNNYILDLKKQYPNYSSEKIKKLANDNLISHSPEFLDKLEMEYPFSDEDYNALSKAYADFKTEYKYLKKDDLPKKETLLIELTEDFNNLAEIPDEKNLEQYLLNKFEVAEKQSRLIKSASEILNSDSKIVSYFEKNNLLKDVKLSPDTKLDYVQKLANQHSLLTEIINVENIAQNHLLKIQEYENHLERIEHSKASLSNIYTNENIINNVESLINDYHTKYILPLENMKKQFSEYKNKNNQELSLVPYRKITFIEKLTGFFNGRNKLQTEFNNKCQVYEAKINLLDQMAKMRKPNYNFDDKLPLAKSIGQDIKKFLVEHPDTTDINACTEVLKNYKTTLNIDIMSFKTNYSDCINNLDTCSSYEELSNRILDEINVLNNKLDLENSNIQSSKSNKNSLCDEYNKNASMPINPFSTINYLNNIDNEYKAQLQKLAIYKGENLDNLKYKAKIEKILETDHSFLSQEEMQDLDATARKKAQFILKHAISDYQAPVNVENEKLDYIKNSKPKRIVYNEFEL